MSTHAVLNDPLPQISHTNLHQELAPAVLEKCRELVAEYAALAQADPAAFPFNERDLHDWYREMTSRVAQPIARRIDRLAPMPRKLRRATVAA